MRIDYVCFLRCVFATHRLYLVHEACMLHIRHVQFTYALT